MTDDGILRLLEERNEQALREVTGSYGRLCHSIAMNILGSEEDAEECVNDALGKLWESVPPNKPKSLSAYICKITRNTALHKLRFYSAEKRSKEHQRFLLLSLWKDDSKMLER